MKTKTIHQTNVETATQGLREYADALRGAWGEIDGRSEKMSLYALAEVFETTDHLVSIERVRSDLDVCPEGDGHWLYFCDSSWIRCGGEDG